MPPNISEIVPRNDGETRTIIVSPTPDVQYMFTVSRSAFNDYAVHLHKVHNNSSHKDPFLKFSQIKHLSALFELLETLLKPVIEKDRNLMKVHDGPLDKPANNN